MGKYKYFIYALIASLLWGTLNTAIKLGYSAYGIETTGDIFVFAGTRFIICGAVMIVYIAITNPELLNIRKSIIPILLSGLFAIVLNYGLQYLGLMTVDSSKTGLLKQSGSLLYVCCSFLFFKEDKFTFKKIIGALVGFLGIVALSSNHGSIKLGVGEIFIVAASLCTIISNIISKKTFCKVQPIAFTGVSQMIGGILLVIVGQAIGGSNHIVVTDARIIMFLYICIASVVSYCFWYTATHKSHLSGMFITKFAEPFFAAVTGAIFLGEDILQTKYFLAFVLILGGIYLSSTSSKV